MKPKVFHWEGVKLMLVEREEPFMNSTVIMTRAIAPNGGCIPVNFTGKTQKDFIAQTIAVLDGFARARSKEEVINELTREL